MPKTTLKYTTKEEIPVALLPYAKDDNSVEVHFNTDDLTLAGELNPALEANRNKILGEKDTVQIKYDSLLQASSQQDKDTAKIIQENKELKANNVPAEDVEIAKTVKTLFPNVTEPTALKTHIETLKTQAETGATLSKEKTNAQIAKALGIKNVDGFNDVLKIPEMLKDVDGEIFLEKVTEGDKTVDRPFVNYKKADGTTEKKAFAEYQKLNDKWALHQPTLMNAPNVESENKGWIPQTGGEGDTGGGQGLVSAHVEKANEAATKVANPFMINAPQQAQGQGAGQPSAFAGVKQN